MSKKRLLRLMEGKHHDKKPKYSRKGRSEMLIRKEVTELPD